MKILYIDWNTYGGKDLKEAFISEGHSLIIFPYTAIYGRYSYDTETEERLHSALHKEVPDIVFSPGYLPVISRVCQQEDVRYLSWIFDCPYFPLYSVTVFNPCNAIYVFDKAFYMEFHNAGISTVHYMPLAANVKRLDTVEPSVDLRSCMYDVSFVGSLYIERFNYFDQMVSALPDRAKGYLDALMAAQLKIRGYDLIQGSLSPIIDDLYKALPMPPEPDGMETREFFYAQYIINRRITAIERIDLLEAVAQRYPVDLFTFCKEYAASGVRNHGEVGYYNGMPQVFKQSRINLNITLRSITSGIPLRVFDIMGCGGFLLSDHQTELFELFRPDEEFVCYADKEDLLRKIGYYLDHEEERRAIARNGYEKVAARHTYRHRVREMLDF